MKRFFGKINGENVEIEGSQLQHLRSVLRMEKGEQIIVNVNDDNDYICTLTEIGKNMATAKINEVKKNLVNPIRQIDLFQALPKREYFEEILTKATELGVGAIIPFVSKFSVMHTYKSERMEQILLTACKQCERSKLPNLSPIISFDKMLNELKEYDIVIFANEHESMPLKCADLTMYNKIAIIIGCEGGFCQEEVEKIKSAGGKSVSLGSRILRCPTAVSAMLAIVNMLTGN